MKRLQITANADAAAEARAFAASVADHALGDTADLQLMVTELVTNAVRHAGHDDIELAIAVEPESVHVRIRDCSTQAPVINPRPGPAGGYGLRIVDSLAERWGVEPVAGGKVVWFDLRRS